MILERANNLDLDPPLPRLCDWSPMNASQSKLLEELAAFAPTAPSVEALMKRVADDQRPAGVQLGHRLAAEIRQAVMPDDGVGAGRRPVAADREPVLVGIHVRIGADRNAQKIGRAHV